MSVREENITDTSRERLGFGVTTAIISAISFGVVTVFAKISYADGANGITFAITRACMMLALSLPLLFLLKRDWRVPKNSLRPMFFVVLGQAGLSISILCAVQFIPVSMALLIMYIYPAIVLLAGAGFLGEGFGKIHIFVCLMAFAGLSLVLGVNLENLDIRGLAFGALACLSTAILTLSMRAVRRNVNEMSAMFWGNFASIPIIVAFVPVLGGLAFPSSQTAWAAMIVGSLFFAAGFSGYAVSMRFIQAGRAALLYNFEPLAALIGAALVLQETLTNVQLLGTTLVFASVLLATRK